MRATHTLFGAAGAFLVVALVGAHGAETPPPATARGQVLFENRCARCHGIGGDGAEGLAPNLTGIVGRPVASHPDFTYSKALKAKGGRWNAETLDRYIADPQVFAPGADMEVNSPDPAERAAIIDYLKTLK